MKTILLSILLLTGFAACSRRDMNVPPDNSMTNENHESAQKMEKRTDPCVNPANPFDYVGYNHNLLLGDCAPLIESGVLTSKEDLQQQIVRIAEERLGIHDISPTHSPEQEALMDHHEELRFSTVISEFDPSIQSYLKEMNQAVAAGSAGDIGYDELKMKIEAIEAVVISDGNLSEREKPRCWWLRRLRGTLLISGLGYETNQEPAQGER